MPIEYVLWGTLAVFWILSPASEHVLVGTLATFCVLSPYLAAAAAFTAPGGAADSFLRTLTQRDKLTNL
jgi:hypothetical protein